MRESLSSGQCADVSWRERMTGKPMVGVLQLVVTSEAARGVDTSVPLKLIALLIGSHLVVRGSVALPEGQRPRRVTIQVLDRGGGRRNDCS